MYCACSCHSSGLIKIPESKVMEVQSVGDWAEKGSVSGSCPSSGQKLEGVLDVGEVGR